MNAYVLSYRDVARALGKVDLSWLIARLADEIEAVYKDTKIVPVKRMGWSLPPKALEIMACQAADLTCVKLISSIPASENSLTVTGTLVCTERGTDQARLVCDAAFLTPLRTAATTAVIMRRIQPNARSLGIVGSGLEGIAHAVALTVTTDSIESIQLYDLDRDQAARAGREIEHLLKRSSTVRDREIGVSASETVQALYGCDSLVTATFAEGKTDALGETERISDGTFIAAVGADLQEKRELPDALYEKAKFIADDLQQCLEDGELQYAKTQCRLTGDNLVEGHRGVLADGRIVGAADFLENPDPFLARDEGIAIYDSAGFSGQDLAVSRVMLELLADCDWETREWNPAESRSLVDLLGCDPLP